MGLFDLFKGKPKQPEDYFLVSITDVMVGVEHPQRKKEEVKWADIETIKIITTDQGPSHPDVWLALLGSETGCLIPQGSKGYDEIYDRVSAYEGFDFENVIKAMGCTDNQEFLVWAKNKTKAKCSAYESEISRPFIRRSDICDCRLRNRDIAAGNTIKRPREKKKWNIFCENADRK